MSSEISKTLRLLRFPLSGLATAVIGGMVNILGWYAFDSRRLADAGFVVCAAGICFSIAMIVIGQIAVIAVKATSLIIWILVGISAALIAGAAADIFSAPRRLVGLALVSLDAA